MKRKHSKIGEYGIKYEAVEGFLGLSYHSRPTHFGRYYSIINETPEPLARYKANVPDGLQRLVDKTLNKDRNIRYQSVADIIADLKGLQKETTGVSVVKSKNILLPFIIPVSIVFKHNSAKKSPFFSGPLSLNAFFNASML